MTRLQVPNGGGAGGTLGRRRWLVACLLGIAALVLLLYGPSLGYGLIWDDPVWFRRGLGKSAAQLLAGSPEYQFYRPLTLWYSQRWWRQDGSLDATGLHAGQVLSHVAATWLVVAVARASRASRFAAVLAGLAFALFPFSHQAVAWAAPQQPWLTVLLLGSTLALRLWGGSTLPVSGVPRAGPSGRAVHATRRTGAADLGLPLLALGLYVAALWTQELAAAMSPALAWLALRRQGRAGRLIAMAIVGAAAAYIVSWWQAPRLEGYAGRGFELFVVSYLLQAASAPITRLLPSWFDDRSTAVLAVSLAAWLLALWYLATSGRTRRALWATSWTGLAMLPVWAGLYREYIDVGTRLVYPAVPGLAWFWSEVVDAAVSSRRSMLRAAAALFATGYLYLSLADTVALDRLMSRGVEHLAEATAIAGRPERASVFVNYPDRMALRSPPYPLGYWGTTLAPVVIEISDFAAAATGSSGSTESWAVPAVGGDARARFPYAVDLRGAPVGTGDLAVHARGADDVYLSEYEPDGSLTLRRVGAIPRRGARLGEVATRVPFTATAFGDTARLVSAEVDDDPGGGEAVLSTWWLRTGPATADTTLFVHVLDSAGGQVAGADGDAWQGLLPVVDWPEGRVVEDQRAIDVSDLAPGRYAVTLGLYRRSDGSRIAPSRSGSAGIASEDGVWVGTLTVR